MLKKFHFIINNLDKKAWIYLLFRGSTHTYATLHAKCIFIIKGSDKVMQLTSLLAEKAAQKLRSGLTVLKVWLPEISIARRIASAVNLSYSPAVSKRDDLTHSEMLVSQY